jgi:general secretion pathway protein C|tara:strand:- start:7907 stop:8947 length:1041 start_codon:yes stop_codon:yes gene_type:complete
LAAGSLSHSSIAGKTVDGLLRLFSALSQPRNVLWLRRGVVWLACLWMLAAAVQLFWALFPVAPGTRLEGEVINPPAQAITAAGGRTQVDIEALRGWALFGDPGAASEVETAVASASEVRSAREGIERGARDSRLELTLRGIIAFNAAGEGSAVIEHRGRQAIYSVDDELPVAGRVLLAKVMPDQVVLDNGGTYELLRLYPPSALDAQLTGAQSRVPRSAAPAASAATVIDRRTDAESAALAAAYRDQLYEDPQSLADLVRISAVREEGVLRGYRVTPGQHREQFKQLGFRPGDLVVAVNGLSLSDPANTMRLYQAMRSASEVSFDLLRGAESVALSVRLDDATTDR